jgi:hypothetical protein
MRQSVPEYRLLQAPQWSSTHTHTHTHTQNSRGEESIVCANAPFSLRTADHRPLHCHSLLLPPSPLSRTTPRRPRHLKVPLSSLRSVLSFLSFPLPLTPSSRPPLCPALSSPLFLPPFAIAIGTGVRVVCSCLFLAYVDTSSNEAFTPAQTRPRRLDIQWR